MHASMAADTSALLRELVARHGVVGASLAVLHDGQVNVWSAGMADLEEGREVTDATPFLIGSTTKSYTATMLMQLVDRGHVALDDRVHTHLPGLQIDDAERWSEVTVRQLLGHTSGIDNGPYVGRGPGDGPARSYVARLRSIPFVHPPGERFGYSNAAYVVAGRLVEALTGEEWADALRAMVLGPAGLNATWPMPDEQLLGRLAVSYSRSVDGQVCSNGPWGIAGRGMAATGAGCATAADLLRFGQLHLQGGRIDGTDVISAASVRLMQQRHVAVPAGLTLADAWGLGWLLRDYSGRAVFGHTGHTGGSGSYLRIFPHAGGAVALVFNSSGDPSLFHELMSELSPALFGVEKPKPWLPIDRSLRLDPTRYTGVYRRLGATITVRADGERLVAGMETGGDGEPRTSADVELDAVTSTAFASGDPGTYNVVPPPGCLAPSLHFAGLDPNGRAGYLYTAVFVAPRVDAVGTATSGR